MSYPIIGIPAERRLFNGSYRNNVNQGEVAAVIKAGGVPVLIPTRNPELAKSYNDLIDGLLLPGGADVAPKFYNEEPLPELGETDAWLDETEIELTKLAVQTGKPILGICRGTQILNVALGGTLYQDIGSQIDTQTYQHFQKAPLDQGTHYADLTSGSILQSIFQGQQHVLVNSHHHESVKEIASQLKLTATASDGVIEGVESQTGELVVGVQWHPELMYQNNRDEFAIFENFIQRVNRRSDKTS